MKMMKIFALAVLGLALLSTGCGRGCDGGNGGGSGTDNRDEVVGSYPVNVSVNIPTSLDSPSSLDIPATLNVEKLGTENLKVSALKIKIGETYEFDFEFTLSFLKEYKDEAGKAVIGYFFKIQEQPFTLPIAPTPILFKGTGSYTGGYDGKIYKGESGSFISFEMASQAARPDSAITIKAETVKQ